MNEFGAIGTALSGMNAASEELAVTGNNIANQGTAGYVEETANLQSVGAAVPSITNLTSGIGQGVTVLGVTRNTNQFLDLQDLVAHGNASNLSQTQSILSDAQDAFDEPSTTGISSQLSSFWSEWDTVANNPTNTATTAALIGQAQGLATSFNQAAANLSQVASTGGTDAINDISQINADATQIAQLNNQIVTSQAGGSSGGGLADQRDALATDLANLAGATTTINQNGSMDVYIGSQMVVQGAAANTVSGSVANGQVSVTWADNNTAVQAGGQLGATVQAVNTTVPGYQAQLDTAANALATSVNNQLAQGVSWTNVGTPSQASTPGIPLFTGNSAATISINPAMTSSTLAVGSPTAGPADGSNAQTIAGLGTAAGSPDSVYASLVGQVGTDVQNATSQSNAASAIQTQADSAQQSAEGVNLDQELANMTQYQNAYTAAAKYLSTVDDTIQSLLTMVGDG
jgi:flagellar hook-associated protein 1 FlgK